MAKSENVAANPGDKVFFVTALEDIELPKIQKLDVGKNLTLTTDWRVIRDHLSEPFRAIIGPMEEDTLMKAPAVLYGVEEVESSSLSLVEYINKRMVHCRVFLVGLWMVKDNSVDHDLAFAELRYRLPDSVISSNYLAAKFLNCRGLRETQAFSLEELKQAVRFNHRLEMDYVPEPHLRMQDRLTRVGRALTFLQAARSTNDLGMKVSYYCTCFEALFSSSTTELTHKLGERVASFVETTPENRLILYKKVKEAYSIRSKVVHGDELNKKDFQKAEKAAEMCDQLLRRILHGIRESKKLSELFDGSNTALDEFLMRVTFGEQIT